VGGTERARGCNAAAAGYSLIISIELIDYFRFVSFLLYFTNSDAERVVGRLSIYAYSELASRSFEISLAVT
jgi:hypothetical protein